ncbi:MAG TPA: diguanylate cyclase [Candidatus Dormibacteraeota bacterium]|nr:diguanylate cyclase [Candidatus Dormibacteraeota bacterium]
MTNTNPTSMSQNESDSGADDIQANLRKLERRDLWVWGNAAIIILSLTAAVVALSVSFYLRGETTLFGLDLKLAVRALVVLVLIFTCQMIYQHLRLRKTQRALAEQQIQAEVFRRLAMFDPLTGLYNRRFAEQRLRSEIARSERRGLSLIVVLVDLNDFKQINDEHGHLAGDHVLKEFAKDLSRSTRGSDLAARWGGDEFILLLLDCEVNQLSLILSRLDGLQVEFQGKVLPITFSVGWKAYEPGDQFDELIEEADRHLYEHKAAAKTPRTPVTTPA